MHHKSAHTICSVAEPTSCLCSPLAIRANIGPGNRQQVLRTCCYKVCSHSLTRACRTPRPVLFVHRASFGRSHVLKQAQICSLHPTQPPKAGTSAMWNYMTAMWGSSGTTDVPLPTDKLARNLPADTKQDPVILLNCGSFNPPTIMHLRMLDVAAQVLRQAGHAVLGAYMSPVNDAYRKTGLLPSSHRIAMSQLAAADSDLVMVDTWEAAQASAQRSLIVLQRIQSAAQAYYDSSKADTSPEQDGSGNQGQQETERHAPSQLVGSISPDSKRDQKHDGVGAHNSDKPMQVKTVLVCGADVLESFIKPGVWVEEQVRQILGQHGVVCIARNSTTLQQLLQNPGNLLHEYRDDIHVTEDPATAGISSTIIRQEVAKGYTVKYLTPNSVVDYIKQHRLYAPAP